MILIIFSYYPGTSSPEMFFIGPFEINKLINNLSYLKRIYNIPGKHCLVIIYHTITNIKLKLRLFNHLLNVPTRFVKTGPEIIANTP
jgi:hypothetical protein